MASRRRWRTRILRLALTGAMSSWLAACGGGGSATAEAPTPGGDAGGPMDGTPAATATPDTAGTGGGTGTAADAGAPEDLLSTSDAGAEDATEAGSPDAGPPDTGPLDAGPPPPELCPDGLPKQAFQVGASGTLRHQVAGDFTVTRLDGMPWTLSERWTGCDTYVFLPDTLPVSQTDATSVWKGDVLDLVKRSPPNVHYFFVSRAYGDAAADTSTNALYLRIGDALTALPQADSDTWWFRLHVVKGRAQTLDGWLSQVLWSGVGQLGFAIDRFQRIRGIGSLADVALYDAQLSAAGAWPWHSNMAYAAYDARYLNAEAAGDHALAAMEATEVPVFAGEVLAGFEEKDVVLPDASAMAGFDTFQIVVDMQCPDATLPEPGNCGAWDYLAHLSVYAGDTRIELGRFITAYHRETHWVLDATPMLPHLLEGGMRTVRWEYAPDWNKQPTATWLTLRFADRGTGEQPAEAAWLFAGGGFGSAYNEKYAPLEVPIPPDATRVMLYAAITGHGGDVQNCAEFCNHAHEFTVNGTVFTKSHPTVGLQTGCIDELEHGMIPHQHGTWWFGRGGWCPGEPVHPWLVDVTSLVEPGGMATVSYRGLLGGAGAPDGAGHIDMTSYLVSWH